ncbi:MAG: nuclear transport factor 2 family protein [Candidatus Bathyarchaeota archaeon]|nr:nuclear transport factor 2 family protein [Candidatus Bathyarchaeota archaeon]
MNRSNKNVWQSLIHYDSNKKSNTEKKILIMVLILDIIVISGIIFYMSQTQISNINVVKSPETYRDTSKSNSTQIPDVSTMTSTANFTTSSPGPERESAILNEESEIRNTLTAYFETLNTHSIEDAVKFFADEVEILINYGKDYSYQGPKEGIVSYLTMAFDLAPDSKISGITISKIKINGDKATVQMNYMISSESYNFSISITEYVDLVKQNNEWRIKRTNITY